MKRFLSAKDLKPIKEFGKIKTKDALYPPILDRDPEFAAEFLTIEDSEAVLPLMHLAIKEASEGNTKTPLLYTVVFSQFNYNWFCTFTNKLEELVLGQKESNFPVLELPRMRERLQVYPPFHVSAPYLIPDKFRVKTTDEIDLHRIKYIRKDLMLEDFRCGFPAWYLMSETTVFEQYNEVTNTRVRIDFRNGEFIYFISGASDNWKQIQDIPLEMDHVVSALLFRTNN